jgi:putative SOS response-associated peptidase YedK
MCGRYTLTIDKSTIEKRFGGRFYIAQQGFEPTYNAAPSQLLPIIRTHAPDRIELAKWGFVREDWTALRSPSRGQPAALLPRPEMRSRRDQSQTPRWRRTSR